MRQICQLKSLFMENVPKREIERARLQCWLRCTAVSSQPEVERGSCLKDHALKGHRLQFFHVRETYVEHLCAKLRLKIENIPKNMVTFELGSPRGPAKNYDATDIQCLCVYDYVPVLIFREKETQVT